MKVDGKVVVVTGAGNGMGRELVREFLRRGARVAGVDVNAKALDETASVVAAGERFAGFVVDITDRAAVNALPARVAEKFGTTDAVINCAGIIQPFVKVQDLDDAAIERVFAVNWWGTLHVTRAFLPMLLTRPAAHVVNVSSMGGFLPVPGQSVYGASKAAVKLFTEGLHAELATTPVRVTVVYPGAIATNIAANSGVAIGVSAAESPIKMYPADKAARDMVDAMEREAYSVHVGRDSKAMDKLYRLNPKRATAFIAKQMRSLLERKG